MKFVDIVSRFGDVTLRVTPVRHPWDTTTKQPAWDMQLTGPDLDCSSVYVEDPESPQTLIEYFVELAEEHRAGTARRRGRRPAATSSSAPRTTRSTRRG